MVAKYKNVPFDWENHPNEDIKLKVASTNRKRSVCLRAAHRILRLGNYTQNLCIR